MQYPQRGSMVEKDVFWLIEIKLLKSNLYTLFVHPTYGHQGISPWKDAVAGISVYPFLPSEPLQG